MRTRDFALRISETAEKAVELSHNPAQRRDVKALFADD